MINTAKRNNMEIVFDALSDNESFARTAVAAFVMNLNPTIEELDDIKTAVSEAVTNSIIHGYEFGDGKIHLKCSLVEGMLEVRVEDAGKGIENIEKAMEPLFTTKPELERSGMGFSFMEAFMDELYVESTLGKGTVVTMLKKLDCGSWIDVEE